MNSPVDLARHDTMPKLMAHNAEKWPDRIAVREKDLGIWIERTWRESLDETSAIACGLVEIGLRPGEVVGLIGQNRPGLLYGQVAAHAAGGMSLGIYEDALAEEVGYLVAFAGAAVILAEDEEQVDKFLDLGDRIPTVRWIVYADPRGMRKHDDPRLMTLASLKERGRARLAKEPDFFRRLVAADDGERVAVLCTTSGTTAHPKLASMAAGPMLRHAAALLHLEAKGPDDQYVSVLPMPWVGEQINAVAQHLVSGIVVNFVEDKTTTNHDLREIGPTTLLYPPRVWEGVQADIKARIMDSSWLKRRFYEIGIDLGLKALDRGERSWLADLLVGRALRDRIGFSRLRSATTGGAALGPDTFRFFRAIGVPLRQVYGQTETAGIHCGHPEGDIDYDTVGKPIPGVEIEIDKPDKNGIGEVIVRHGGMFKGYYRNDEAFAETMVEGWMHTGDAGYFKPNGHLVVIDRVRDMSETARGDRFSPQYLENKLKFSPYVGECMVLGHGRDFIAAIVCIRYSIVSKWAEARRIAFTTYTDLSARPEIYDLVRAEIERINAGLPAAVRIRRFLLLYKEFDADDGELTRTRKLRRGTIEERYGDIIGGLYDGRARIDVDTTITLQDGRKSRIVAALKVVDLAPGAAP